MALLMKASLWPSGEVIRVVDSQWKRGDGAGAGSQVGFFFGIFVFVFIFILSLRARRRGGPGRWRGRGRRWCRRVRRCGIGRRLSILFCSRLFACLVQGWRVAK